MNCRAQNRKVENSEKLKSEISRIDKIWTELRQKYSDTGLYLFGDFSIADCMFAPVVFRFNTYNVAVSDESQTYMNSMMVNPHMQTWLDAARLETETIEIDEAGE